MNSENTPAGDAFFPPEPESIQATGLSLGFLADLAIKVLYFRGYVTGATSSARSRAPAASAGRPTSTASPPRASPARGRCWIGASTWAPPP